jgi:hypothetical protein
VGAQYIQLGTSSSCVYEGIQIEQIASSRAPDSPHATLLHTSVVEHTSFDSTVRLECAPLHAGTNAADGLPSILPHATDGIWDLYRDVM